jgi:hypothetical protein
MDYSKVTRTGGWAKAAELKEGQKAKIVDECQPIESQFLDDKGNKKTQDVCKVRFEGFADALNVNLNRATIKGLVEAFGKDSKDWIGNVLTVHTEKVAVAGKRVTALYLVPEGFEVGENDEGYVEIKRKGDAPAATDKTDSADGFDASFDEALPPETIID